MRVLKIEHLLEIMNTHDFSYEFRQAAWRELCLRCARD